jgi:hypothetical protein
MPCVNDAIHLEHELTEYALGQAHPFVHTWLGDRLRKDLRKSTSSMIALITDVEAARTFSEAMSVLGLPPDPFRARLLEIDGYRFLAQIHFADRSGKLPYVEVYRASTPLGAIDDQIIVRKLRDRFDVFRPQGVRFFHSTHIPMLAPATQVDQHFLVAPARDMAMRPEAPGFGRVVLRRPRNLDFYPRYVEAYEQMFTARPQLRGQVRIEPEKSLVNCLEQELLFEIYVDDAWAGIVAASSETRWGDRVLYERNRPRRRGPRPGPGSCCPPAFCKGGGCRESFGRRHRHDRVGQRAVLKDRDACRTHRSWSMALVVFTT